MIRITLATGWKELPPGWRWVFGLGGLLALLLPLLAHLHLNLRPPGIWFRTWQPLELLGRGLPLAVAVALVAVAGRWRPLCLLALASLAAAGIAYLLSQTGWFQPVLWKGRKVTLRRTVETQARWDPSAQSVIIRNPRELEVWRRAVAEIDEACPRGRTSPSLGMDFASEMGVMMNRDHFPLDHVEARESGGVLHVLLVLRNRWKSRWCPTGFSETRRGDDVVLAVMDRTTLPVVVDRVFVRGFGGDFPQGLERSLCYWDLPTPLGRSP